jgi:hypothetical protein
MVVDYAEHIIRLRKFLKDSEKALLNSQWDEASSLAVDSVVELRLLQSQIKLLKENGGTPYQTSVEFFGDQELRNVS